MNAPDLQTQVASLMVAADKLKAELLENVDEAKVNALLDKLCATQNDADVNNAEGFCALIYLCAQMCCDSPEPSVAFVVLQKMMQEQMRAISLSKQAETAVKH